MWKLISGYVLAVFTMKEAAYMLHFEHEQAAFTHGKLWLVLSTTCRKNHKEWWNFGSVFSGRFSQVRSSEILAVYFLVVSHK